MLENTSEKITINISVVDLGSIDYLVSQGFYGNRTDFLRTAIKRQLDSHRDWLDKEFVAKNMDIGFVTMTKSVIEEKEYQDYVVLGKLVIEEDVSLELLKKVFRKITVFGIIRCKPEIKRYYDI